MPTRSVATQYFPETTIPIIDEILPYSPFHLRKNATAQLSTPLVDSGSTLYLSVKGIEYGTTLFDGQFQTLLWGIGSTVMFQLGTIGSMFFVRLGHDLNGSWSQCVVDYPGQALFGSKDLITPETEVSYEITPRITTDEDWALSISETIPGRTPQETVVSEVIVDPWVVPFLASEAFPMTFYVGWIPDYFEGTLGLPIYSQVGCAGHDRGLIYTSLSVR